MVRLDIFDQPSDLLLLIKETYVTDSKVDLNNGCVKVLRAETLLLALFYLLLDLLPDGELDAELVLVLAE